MSASYELAYTEAALKFLEVFVPSKIGGQIKRKTETLCTTPHPPGSKKLQGVTEGTDQVYRIRSGDYRILYIVKANPKQVIVLDIDNRKDVYK